MQNSTVQGWVKRKMAAQGARICFFLFFLSRSRLPFPYGTLLITERRQEVTMGCPLPSHPASACFSTSPRGTGKEHGSLGAYPALETQDAEFWPQVLF